MLISLLLTLVIELATLFLLRNREAIFYLYWAAVTTLTNVLANACMYLVPFEGNRELCALVLALELLVFVSELFLCFLYTKSFKTSAKYSAVCNLASFCIGSPILMIISL